MIDRSIPLRGSLVVPGIVLALLLLVTTREARACTRVESPLAERLWEAPTVMFGTVTSVEPGVAVLEVRTSVRGEVGPIARIENREIGYDDACKADFGEDGRFEVGDILVVFVGPNASEGPLRPIGWLGEGVFLRTEAGAEWVGDRTAVFDERSLLAFARGELRLVEAAQSERAREVAADEFGLTEAEPEPSAQAPPPVAPARGCRVAADAGPHPISWSLLGGLLLWRRRWP